MDKAFVVVVLATMNILPVAFGRAADKPMVVATFTMLRFMASKVAGDGWARDRCRDR
jgi:ABC-type Zn uptake system ZnuABC Zn-binding protein ZnuA